MIGLQFVFILVLCFMKYGGSNNERMLTPNIPDVPGVPSARPTFPKIPSQSPTKVPSMIPTTPTVTPTDIPTSTSATNVPTEVPTNIPSNLPTFSPSKRPSPAGTVRPTMLPTILPTILPTLNPTNAPTNAPSFIPSNAPIDNNPTQIPTTVLPTSIPSSIPTIDPTFYPTLSPNSIAVITTIAGVGTDGYSGDNGAATSANLHAPTGIVIDSLGNIYISDSGNNRVRKVTSTGIITTFAGTGTPSYGGDNEAATSASLSNPTGLGLDISGLKFYFKTLILIYNLTNLFFIGNIYVSDTDNNRVRKITVSTSIITTVAGSSTSASYSGDNSQATSATFDTIVGVALDSSSKYN